MVSKPDGVRREIADGAAPGLRLVVQPSGAKSFAFRYERPGGHAAKVTLGPAAGPGALSLADARQRVSDMRREMASGADPADKVKARRAAAVQAEEAATKAMEVEARREESQVGAVLDRYVAHHVAGLKSGQEVRRLFDKEVRPAWSGLPIEGLKRQDVAALIQSIAKRGAGTTANRTLANVRAFLAWCVDQGIIERSPADRMRPAVREVVRDRTLDDAELAAFVKAIASLDWPWRPFLMILALTGQRRDEVAGMRWSELDLASTEPTWLIPAARTKNGRAHTVPLAPQSAETLRSLPRMDGSSFVFTTTGSTAVSGFSRAKASLDSRTALEDGTNLAPWRLHDLRRSVASAMARLGVSIAVVEKVLNHVSGTFGGIVGVYQRHDFASEKREALSLWANHLELLGKRSV